MRIGELATASGVGVETVRFYEKKGLIEQPLRPRGGGYREYPEDAVRRIRFIRSAQNLGFTLAEVDELLALEAGPSSKCAHVLQRAQSKRAQVQARIDDLGRIRRVLDTLIDACPGAGPARDCSILEAINSGQLRLGAPSRKNGHDREKAKD